MRHQPFLLLPAALLSCCLLGCATMSDVLSSKSDGTAQVYPVNADQAWGIAIAVLRWEGCATIEEHQNEGYMLTTVEQNVGSAGALVGVWVERMNGASTRIIVVTKRKIQTSVFTGLTEATFQKRFAQAVAIVNSGKPLPIQPPATVLQ